MNDSIVEDEQESSGLIVDGGQVEEPSGQCKSLCSGGNYHLYDKTFQVLLCLQYLNNGTRVMALTSINYLFKDYYQLDPGTAQTLMVVANFPWSLKLLYGLVVDNCSIGRSRKKGFMLLGAALEFFALMVLFWARFTAEQAYIVAILAMIINLTQAFMDLIVDTILIDQARKSEATGSEDLRSLASFFQCSGMVIGSLVGGYVNQYYEPYWCFLIYSSVSLCVSAAALGLNSEIDTKGIDQLNGFCVDLKRSFTETIKIRHIPEIWMTLLFLVVSASFNPGFGEFGFYYN